MNKSQLQIDIYSHNSTWTESELIFREIISSDSIGKEYRNEWLFSKILRTLPNGKYPLMQIGNWRILANEIANVSWFDEKDIPQHNKGEYWQKINKEIKWGLNFTWEINSITPINDSLEYIKYLEIRRNESLKRNRYIKVTKLIELLKKIPKDEKIVLDFNYYSDVDLYLVAGIIGKNLRSIHIHDNYNNLSGRDTEGDIIVSLTEQE